MFYNFARIAVIRRRETPLINVSPYITINCSHIVGGLKMADNGRVCYNNPYSRFSCAMF